MQDAPSAHELVRAVQTFLEDRAMVELKGHSAFHARVAANALGIVARELELGPAASARERERLEALLGRKGALDVLNHALCQEIREGRMGLETPGLVAHLKKTTLDKVAIDQPRYKALELARKAWTDI